MSNLSKQDAPQLPRPVVSSEMFLHAIVFELQRMNEFLEQISQIGQPQIEPNQPEVTNTEDSGETDIELKEPEAHAEVEQMETEEVETEAGIQKAKRKPSRKAK